MADTPLAQALAFANVVQLELGSAAPTIAINHPMRAHLDRAILAIGGIRRALVPPPVEQAPDETHAESTRCTFCREPFTETAGGHKTREHLIPKHIVGNALGALNLAGACKLCNSLKNGHSPETLRSMADDTQRQAERMRAIADRAEWLIEHRGLKR